MKPLVAHYIQDYLIPTTQWIYGQIQSNTEFAPVVLARHLTNTQMFPVENLFARDQLPRWQSTLDEIYYRTCGYSRFFATRLHELSKSTGQSVSLIHAHFGHIGFKALGLAQQLRVPLIASFYGYDVSALGRDLRYRRRYAQLFSKGQLFLAEGPCLARSLEALGCPKEKIRIFHLGVTPPPLPALISRDEPSQNKTVRVLFAATFTEKKGWSDALRAFANAAEQTARFTPRGLSLRLRLIGGGEDELQVNELIRRLGVESLIDRSGYLSHEELLREMMNSDIFLQPSRTAANGNTEGGAPVTLIDAQSVKLAICATTHADIPEVAPHEVSSLLSPEGNIEALTKNLLQLALNADLRRRLGENGRTHIESEYNWAKQGPRLAEIYRSVISSGHT